MPIERRLGKFFARSITTTNVPMAAPSRLRSPARPAVCGIDFGVGFRADLDPSRGMVGKRIWKFVF